MMDGMVNVQIRAEVAAINRDTDSLLESLRDRDGPHAVLTHASFRAFWAKHVGEASINLDVFITRLQTFLTQVWWSRGSRTCIWWRLGMSYNIREKDIHARS